MSKKKSFRNQNIKNPRGSDHFLTFRSFRVAGKTSVIPHLPEVRVVIIFSELFSSSTSSPAASSSQSRSQWAQPDLHCELQIPVGTAGPPPRAPDPSGHCRTSTATSRSQWALPDLNRDFQIAVGTAGPQPRLPDRSGHCRTSTATSRSQWALPDLNGKNMRKDVR